MKPVLSQLRVKLYTNAFPFGFEDVLAERSIAYVSIRSQSLGLASGSARISVPFLPLLD